MRGAACATGATRGAGTDLTSSSAKRSCGSSSSARSTPISLYQRSKAAADCGLKSGMTLLYRGPALDESRRRSFKFHRQAMLFAFGLNRMQDHLQFGDLDLGLVVGSIPRHDVVEMNDEVRRIAGIRRRRGRRDRQHATALTHADRAFG